MGFASTISLNPRNMFYGWWIVSVGVVLAIINGSFYVYGFGVFYLPLLNELGTTRAALGGVIGLARLEGGLIAPIAGWLIDKFGPRKLLYIGLSTVGICFLLLSVITKLWMLYVVFMLIATGSSFGGGRPISVAVANWFLRKRARALGILLAGIGLGGSGVFFVAWITESFGWRTSAIVAALCYFFIAIPLVSLVYHKPEDLGLHPDGIPVEQSLSTNSADEPLELELTPKQALQSISFWLLAIAFAAWSVTVTVVAIYHIPFLIEDLGTSPVQAASIASLTLLLSVPGRIIFGWIGDILNIRILLSATLFVQAISILIMSLVTSPSWVPLYMALLGPSYGGSASLRQAIVAHFYGRKNFGTISGLLQFVDLPGAVLGPILVGWLVDSFDGYSVGFQAAAGFLFIGAIAVFVAKRPNPNKINQ